MNSIQNYKNLIKQLPFKDQSFKSELTIWEKFKGTNKLLSKTIESTFDNTKSVQISRQDLYDLSNTDQVADFTFKTILWGYPSGLRGNNFLNIATKFDELVNHIEKIKSKGNLNWNEETNFLQSFSGLGLSTHSKFLHFQKVHINSAPCLILDLQLINVFQNSNFKELSSLGTVSYTNAIKNYPLYLEEMDKISKELNVNNSQLELFLFLFGRNLKKS